LAERKISEPDLGHRVEHSKDSGIVRVVGIEQPERLVHGQREYVGDALSAMGHRKNLWTETLALADGAQERDVGEKLHLDGLVAFPGACFASS
jgi:hypothetical protein